MILTVKNCEIMQISTLSTPSLNFKQQNTQILMEKSDKICVYRVYIEQLSFKLELR